jgi:hypothetical protein
VRESPGRNGIKSGRARGSISRAEAEGKTGIRHQQVSEMRRSLADPGAYYEELRRSAQTA